MAKKEWNDLSSTQKWGIVLGGTVQIGLILGALFDVYRRPKEQIRSKKLWWTLAAFVNFVGPISYFLFGRKR